MGVVEGNACFAKRLDRRIVLRLGGRGRGRHGGRSGRGGDGGPRQRCSSGFRRRWSLREMRGQRPSKCLHCLRAAGVEVDEPDAGRGGDPPDGWRPRQEVVLEDAAHELTARQRGEQRGLCPGRPRFRDVPSQVRRRLRLEIGRAAGLSRWSF